MNIKPLPHWAIVSKFPAYFDTEGATVLEQTARLYAKVNELIESYNKYITDINTQLENYTSEKDKDYNCFVNTIVKITSDYIAMLDLKIVQHDRKWDEYYVAFTESIIQTTKTILSELKANGELDKAVLEAIGDLEGKFDELRADYDKKIEEIDQLAKDFEYDYENIKAQMVAEYNTAKTNFESALATLNQNISEFRTNLQNIYDETAEQLQTDYQNTKTSLQTDYNTTKTNLESDYNTTKTDLQTDYENAKTEVALKIKDADMHYKHNKYRHLVAIYGVLNHATEGQVRIAFNFVTHTYREAAFTSVEDVLNSLPKSKRIPLNGFLKYNNDQTSIEIWAGCYQHSIDDNGVVDNKFWIFSLNSVDGYPTYTENGSPLNLFNHLDELNIIDDVVDTSPEVVEGTPNE